MFSKGKRHLITFIWCGSTKASFNDIKGTAIEQYKIVEYKDLKKEMDMPESISQDGRTRIPIDHCFDVKGVGTVILGKVVQGK